MPPSSNECATCGMLGGEEQPEFHPHALCLLVKARNGDTDTARDDLAFIIGAARTKDPVTRAMVDRFMRQVKRRG
jgi:hypothetical protein